VSGASSEVAMAVTQPAWPLRVPRSERASEDCQDAAGENRGKRMKTTKNLAKKVKSVGIVKKINDKSSFSKRAAYHCRRKSRLSAKVFGLFIRSERIVISSDGETQPQDGLGF
jgi:hypothetical protein